MARTLRSRSGAALAGGLLLTGVAACGDDGEVTESAQSTSTQDQAQLAQAEPGGEVPAQELVQRLTSPGGEEFSSFEFALDFAQQQDEYVVNGAVDLSGNSPVAQVTMDVPPLGAVDALLVDGSAYVNIPDITPPGKYFEVSAQDLTEFGMADVRNSLDLNALLQEWDAGAPKVTFVGAEEVNGAMTDHYEIVVDPQAALDAAGATAPSDTDLSGSQTYGVWVGQDDLIRQLVLDIDGSTATVSMDNWGQEVQVQAPDPADVVDLPSF